MKLSIVKSLMILAYSGVFLLYTTESVQAEEQQMSLPTEVEYFWDLSFEEQSAIEKDVKLKQLAEATDKVDQLQEKWTNRYNEAEEKHEELKWEKDNWLHSQVLSVDTEEDGTFFSKLLSLFPLAAESEVSEKEIEDLSLEDIDFQLTTTENELRIIAAQLERVKVQADEITQFREDIITNSAIEKAAYEEMKSVTEELEEDVEDVEIEEQIEIEENSFSSREIFNETDLNDLVTQAIDLIGIDYVFGGSSIEGFDSSGLVEYIFEKTGFEMKSTVSSQFMQVEKVNQTEIQPGDLIFFNQTGRIDHVGIYLGNEEFISAQPTKGVIVESIQSDYWLSNLSSVGRVS